MPKFGASGLNLTEYRAEDQTPDAIGWNYLASTTIVHPIGANNVTDMFPPFNWSLADTAYFAKHDFNGAQPISLFLPPSLPAPEPAQLTLVPPRPLCFVNQ